MSEKNESCMNEVRSKLKQNKNESDWRFNQRVLKEMERYLHLNAMANGHRTQYVKPANRKGYLAN